MSQWKTDRRGSQQRASGSRHASGQLADFCLKIVDFGLAGVIFVGPHLFGGRHLLGRFVILALCATAALAWCIRQFVLEKPGWTRTPPLGILVVCIGWVAFQLVPIPTAWLDYLAPQQSELLPIWKGTGPGASLGNWKTLSLAPEDTRLALATLIGYGLLFVTAVQRMQTFDDVKRIARWIATSAVIVAAYGVLQYFTANGKYFWFYEHPYAETTGELKAGFTSRNHCAHFLVLGFANLYAWIMLERSQDRTERRLSTRHRTFAREESHTKRRSAGLVLTIAATLLMFAVLASLSRGGIIAMVSAIGVSSFIYARAHLLNFNHFVGGTVLILLMLGALTFSGSYDKLASRMESLVSKSLGEIDDEGGRRKIWSANIEAFQASRITGWGAGSHRLVYPLFLGEPTTKEFTHAENGYLQIATEHGVIGLALVGAIILTCGWWCVQAISASPDDQSLKIVAGGIAGALAASATHSIVDFIWFIPACMSVTILLAACALRLSQLATEGRHQPAHEFVLTPLARFNGIFAASLGSLWVIYATFPAAATSLKWDAYLRAEQAMQVAGEMKPTALENQLAEIQESESLNGAALTENLSAVARDYPNCSRAHVRLAGILLNRFEELQQRSDNAMTIGQIREAAVVSHFATPQALHDWLMQAFGNNSKLLYLARRHARHALQLCPLQGEAYLYLAELAFLEGQGTAGYTAYVDQALRVRPDDAEVLFAIGKNEFIAGDVEESLRHWAQAYRGSGKHQFHIVQILAGRMSAHEFLKRFSPDWRTLEIVWSGYKRAGSANDLQAILPYATEQARHHTSDYPAALAGKVWHDLACMQLEMDDVRGALDSLGHSYTAFPESVNTRRQMAKCLMRFQKYDLAESHLRWCAQKYPENPTYRTELLQATRGKMQQLARSTQSQLN